jgi:hypothetical protein
VIPTSIAVFAGTATLFAVVRAGDDADRTGA